MKVYQRFSSFSSGQNGAFLALLVAEEPPPVLIFHGNSWTESVASPAAWNLGRSSRGGSGEVLV